MFLLMCAAFATLSIRLAMAMFHVKHLLVCCRKSSDDFVGCAHFYRFARKRAEEHLPIALRYQALVSQDENALIGSFSDEPSSRLLRLENRLRQ